MGAMWLTRGPARSGCENGGGAFVGNRSFAVGLRDDVREPVLVFLERSSRHDDDIMAGLERAMASEDSCVL